MTPMSLPEAVRLSERLWPALKLTAAEWARLLSLMCQRPIASDEAAVAVCQHATSDRAEGKLGVQQEGR